MDCTWSSAIGIRSDRLGPVQRDPVISTQLVREIQIGSEGRAPSGFFEDLWLRYSDTLLQQVLTSAAGFLTGILTARLLGPYGRGELAAVTVWPITLIFLCSFGLERTLIYFAGKSRDDISPVASSAMGIGAVQTAAAILIGWLAIPIALRGYGTPAIRWSLVFLLAAPIVRLDSLQGSLLLGTLRTRPYNFLAGFSSVFYAAGIAALFLRNIPSVSGIVIVRLLGVVLAACMGFKIIRQELRMKWSWNRAVAAEMTKYGLKTNLGELSYFMNNRLDQLLMSLLLPGATLGIYVAAVAFSDALCILPRGIAIVTLATGSNSNPTTAMLWTKRSLTLTAAWVLPAALLMWILCPVLIPRLFGHAFAGAILPCRILILGSCAMSFTGVLSESARSVNHPEIPSYAEFSALLVTAGLLLLLLKPFGAVGAAIASSAAYAWALAFTAFMVSKKWRALGPS